MPIYEYECNGCDQITEALQKFSDAPLSKCPNCGGKLHKIMSLNAFQLKGSGWYVTDYKGKNSSTSAKAETSAKTESKPKEAKKAEKTSKKKDG
jgi:putative FmdB family regulatory protein